MTLFSRCGPCVGWMFWSEASRNGNWPWSVAPGWRIICGVKLCVIMCSSIMVINDSVSVFTSESQNDDDDDDYYYYYYYSIQSLVIFHIYIVQIALDHCIIQLHGELFLKVNILRSQGHDRWCAQAGEKVPKTISNPCKVLVNNHHRLYSWTWNWNPESTCHGMSNVPSNWQDQFDKEYRWSLWRWYPLAQAWAQTQRDPVTPRLSSEKALLDWSWMVPLKSEVQLLSLFGSAL